MAKAREGNLACCRARLLGLMTPPLSGDNPNDFSSLRDTRVAASSLPNWQGGLMMTDASNRSPALDPVLMEDDQGGHGGSAAAVG